MSSDPSIDFELLGALEQPGCALCRLARQTTERYLASILYESVNDLAIQQAFIASRGLCSTHSEQLLVQRNPLGTAILFRAILTSIRGELDEPGSSGGEWLGRLVTYLGGRREGDRPAGGRCLACVARDEATRRRLDALRGMREGSRLARAVAQSDGFCLPHLQEARLVLSGPALDLLLRRQQEMWEGLEAQLAEFIRKNDYRFRDEKFGAEGDAWQRAVRAMAGMPGVF